MVADFKQSTNLAGKILASGQVPSTTSLTILTVGAGQAVKIATMSLTNTSNAAVTVSVSVVPTGGSVDGTHLVLSTYSLAAFDAISHEDVLSMVKGLLLDAGAFIAVTCGTSAVIDYLVTGAVSS